MKQTIINNSVVILASSHNPTLISDVFLIESGMISDIKEIVPQNKFITPGYTQLTFTSGVNFTLEPNRLVILKPKKA